jgi:hypothetical protein
MSLLIYFISLFHIVHIVHAVPISVDFNGFEASFSQSQGLILTFKFIGGKGAL